MALDRRNWAIEFLKELGNPNPSENTIKFVMAWEIAESGTSLWPPCMNNPLNTTQGGIGKTTDCNKVGVKNYNDFTYAVGSGGPEKQGLDATKAAITNGLYPSLLHALQTNDENNLGFNGNPMAGNIAGDLSVWSTGKRTRNDSYINNILKLAGQKSLPSIGDIGEVTPAPLIPTDPLAALSSAFQVLTSPGTWIKVGVFLLALLLLIVGFLILVHGNEGAAS